MSLLSTERCVASLAPGHVATLRTRAGWRPALLAKRHATAEKNLTQPWQSELQLFEDQLQETKPGTPLTVVLSNQYVRYRIVPATPPMMPPAAAQGLVTHCMREVYGEEIAHWDIRTNPLPYGDVSIGCAVDTALIAGIREIAERQGLRLQSIQPYFMAGFNQVRRSIKKTSSCFAQVENGRLVIATYLGGTWQTLNTIAISQHWNQELLPSIRRELLVSGFEGDSLQLFLSVSQATPAELKLANSAWEITPVAIKSIQGLSPLDAVPYAMALSGV